MTKDSKAVPEWARRESRILDRLYGVSADTETAISTTISREYKTLRPWYSDDGDESGGKKEGQVARGHFKRR